MPNNVIVSVILPVYNAQDYISEAIESILNQTFQNFELILINDGSSDDSLEIINSYSDHRIRVINQKNKGLARSLNIGLAQANGKFIARMDADDISLANRLEVQVRFLEKNPHIKLVGSAVDLIDKNGHLICSDVSFTGNSFLKWFLKNKGNPFKHPTVLFHKEVAINVGGYNEKIGKYFEDYYLWNEISKHGDIEIINKVLLKYRITPGSIMSSVKTKEFSDFMLSIIKKETFSDEDQADMEKIKNKENKGIDSMLAYKNRIYTSKNNRMNKLFLKTQSLLGTKIAFWFISKLKKLNVLFSS